MSVAPSTSRALRTALLCACVLAGCSRQGPGEKEGGKKPREMTTAEVLAVVAKAVYQPPGDGRLTNRQVRLYLEVKRRAAKDRVQTPRPREPVVTADLRAALELGFNPKELAWVHERVREAWIALQGQELDRKIAASRAEMLRDLESRLQAATDPRQKRELEQQIAEIRAAAPLATEAPPAVTENAALIRRYRREVARAFAEDRGPQESQNAR